MGNMSENFIKSRWIPFIWYLEKIREEVHTLCVWNGTIVVLIFLPYFREEPNVHLVQDTVTTCSYYIPILNFLIFYIEHEL
jgi:hypothetical protein